MPQQKRPRKEPPAPTRKPDICNNFNTKGYFYNGCHRRHVCIWCGGNHSQYKCPHQQASKRSGHPQLWHLTNLDSVDFFPHYTCIARINIASHMVFAIHHSCVGITNHECISVTSYRTLNGTHRSSDPTSAYYKILPLHEATGKACCEKARVWPTLTHTHYGHRISSFDLILAGALSTSPNRQFLKLILSGLDSGFPIGFEATSKLRSANANLILARDRPQVVSQYIQDELARNQIGHVGSLETALSLGIQLSPLGAIPKKGKSDKWQLIM